MTMLGSFAVWSFWFRRPKPAKRVVKKTTLVSVAKQASTLGWELTFKLVMLNLFQHPWPELEFGAAPKETADHGS